MESCMRAQSDRPGNAPPEPATARPWGQRRGSRLFHRHRFRRLVLAFALEGGVSQDSIAGPGGESDLDHQTRLDPVDAAPVFPRNRDEGRLWPVELSQPGRQLPAALERESGSDL